MIVAGVLYRHFSIDDAYIFLVYAKHLSLNGQMAFNLGEPVNGLSSPAWFCVSYGAFRLAHQFGTLDLAIVLTRVASGLCAWLAAIVFTRATFARFDRAALRALALVLFLADPWLWRWAFTGMEASLALLIVTGAIALQYDRDPLRRFLAPMLALSLGTLARPEIGVLGALLLAHWIWSARHGADLPSRRATLVSIAVAALPMLLWAGFAHSSMQSILPQTAAVKRGVLSSREAFKYAAQVLGSSQLVAMALCIGGGAFMAWSLARSPRTMVPAPRQHGSLWPFAVWTALLLAFYVGLGYVPLARYLLMAMPCIVWLGVSALERAATLTPSIERRLERVSAVAIVAAILLSSYVTLTRALPVSTGKMENGYRSAGLWIRAHTPEHATIAVGEIGVLAYYADRRFLDFGRLVLTREQLALWRQDPVVLLRAVRPDYVLTPCNLPAPEVSYEPVLKWSVPGHRASIAGDWVHHVLYHAKWAADTLHADPNRPRGAAISP